MPGWRRGNVAIRQGKWEGNVWAEEKGMGTMLMFTYWGKIGGYMCAIQLEHSLTAQHGLPPMGYCRHTYAQGRAASISTATPEAKPHLTGGKEFKRMDSSSQANKEKKTTNTRPHHFTNSCLVIAVHTFIRFSWMFQRQKCWSYQEHRVTLLWIERKKII